MDRRRKTTSQQENRDAERIRRLEDDLWITRQALLDFMPEEFREVLSSYYRCKTGEAAAAWSRSTAERITDLLKSRISVETEDYETRSPRVVCPLCGKGSVNPWGIEGFAFPVGLLWHLEGSHKSRQCIVFSAAEALARDYLKGRVP